MQSKIIKMTKKKRGGARAGAGRPTGQGRYGEPTELMRIPRSQIDKISKFIESQNKTLSIPLYDMKVEAGTPAITDSDDYELYNLNEDLFISDPDNYFLVKVSGYSMKNAGILPDDMLLVNRNREAKNGDIIIASIDNGAVVKRLSQKNGIIKLVSENDDYPDIKDEDQNLHFWGVVTKVIRDC